METICAEISYFLIFGYLLYLVSFMSIVTLDCDRMKLDAKVKKIAVKSFICMLLVIGAVFLSSEVRQFIHRPYYYIRNIYNLVDVVSLVMPMAYAINSRRWRWSIYTCIHWSIRVFRISRLCKFFLSIYF